MKRQKRRELLARQGLTWQKVVQLCTQTSVLDQAGLQEAHQDLRSLLQAAKQIGECVLVLSPPTPQDVHVFVLNP